MGTAANLTVTFEALAGLMGFALLTGLFFSRFSRPTARVIFSRVAVIHSQDGVPCLTFRIANERLNQITEAKVQVVLVKKEKTLEGEVYRNLHDLKLERAQSPLFTLSWSIVHPIDATSPLYGLSQKDLEMADAELLVSFTGMDGVFSQQIHSRFSYIPQEILWNHRFVDILTRGEDGRLHILMDQIHNVEAV